MNRLFGFFRDKLSEAKEENQNEIQNLVTAFDVEPYSKQKMLSYMQEIKTNYLEWNIMIANEASTGLYYAQLHNKSCALKKIRALKDREDKISKHEIVLEQMHRTIKELKSIDRLNKEWANDMNRKVEKLGSIVAKERGFYLESKGKSKRELSKTQEYIQEDVGSEKICEPNPVEEKAVAHEIIEEILISVSAESLSFGVQQKKEKMEEEAVEKLVEIQQQIEQKAQADPPNLQKPEVPVQSQAGTVTEEELQKVDRQE